VHFFQNKDKKQAVHNLADSYKQTEYIFSYQQVSVYNCWFERAVDSMKFVFVFESKQFPQ